MVPPPVGAVGPRPTVVARRREGTRPRRASREAGVHRSEREPLGSLRLVTLVEVVVVGAGPGGLAVAAALADRGAGARRRPRAARRQLVAGPLRPSPPHTLRRWSGLPGSRSRAAGQWVARDDVVHYLRGVCRPPPPRPAARLRRHTHRPGRCWRRHRHPSPTTPGRRAAGSCRHPRARVEPVAAVASFDGPDVVLADGRRLPGGCRRRRRGLPRGPRAARRTPGGARRARTPVVHGAHEPPGAPGLWFTGFTNPISGSCASCGSTARRIATGISRAGASSRS